MPILQAEIACFPDNLLAGDAAAPEMSGRSWWALHTRPRQEKSLARNLFRSEIPFFLPLIPKRSRIRKRILTSHIPLFTGYVFMLADGEERMAALQSGHIARLISVADAAGLWRDLRQVHRLIASGSPLSPEGQLVPGMLVEITSGPLAGLKGKIIRGASRSRFVVAVDFIQRGVSVVVDDFTLHPVSC